MAMRRVSKRLLNAGEGVRNYFADPVIVKVQNALKYEAEIAKRGDLAKQMLERIKAEYSLSGNCFSFPLKLSAEYKEKHGAADKFMAVIVSSAIAVYAWYFSLNPKT
ncbi:hypothetical protein MKW94_027115 [Papaver nudicaule]|uniref:Uncharacterized protein n=1 Tax=Papaver nudicaule TaxID=74823 RepID=A0AA41SIX7_PAPNU|nr:hypothetical protein [Papaver nudicaule]